MVYIFLDESGDLGFSEKSSKWFLMAAVFTKSPRRVEKVIKKTRKGLKKKYKKVAELHAYHSQPITKKRILRGLAEVDDLAILTLVLNKKKVFVDFKNQKAYLYNFLANTLLSFLKEKKYLSEESVFEICIDQRETKKFLRENFINYLTENLEYGPSKSFKVKIKPSHTEKCLQAIDFISWAIFRKYEQNDYEYYEIIKDKIIEEEVMFP